MENIKKDLTNTCAFLSAWKDINETSKRPEREIGFVRAYIRNGCWQDNYQIVHNHHVTHARWSELLNVSRALMKAFPTLDSLACFCANNAECKGYNEYNLYYEGCHAQYWIRAIIRPGDYNLYVHSIVKEGS